MRRVVPLEVTHLAKRGLSESLRSVARSMQYDYARVKPQRLVRVLFQELFRIEGGHAAGAGGGDGLTIAMVLNVAGDEHAGNGRQAAVIGDEVAVAVHFQLALEDGRVRIVANGDEHALDGDFARFLVCKLRRRAPSTWPCGSENLLDNERSDKLNLSDWPWRGQS